ncbi:MAG: type II toxin-antitoxin system VapC family toxin [Aphanocapsa sp. GSE-SYN-MK-11-07L]|jgi:PIN domain nuclease of toxin-antitoxin system|nr:type II toxin-antitoxin system VapC family toxin [Aphanocapsa sp. GSE-SYN-MK-11-07L]
MRLLLDTHTFIWFVTDSPQLSSVAKGLIQVFVEQQIQQNSMELLPIEMPHLARVEMLPLHHRDPFDRLLLAQALVENIPIVGMDVVFDTYSVQRFW